MQDYLIEEFKAYKVFLAPNGDKVSSIHIQIPSGSVVIIFQNGQLPSNNLETKGNGNKLFNIYVQATNFPYYIDLMRNERPLFFYYNYVNNLSYITTSAEPVGEGEGSDE